MKTRREAQDLLAFAVGRQREDARARGARATGPSRPASSTTRSTPTATPRSRCPSLLRGIYAYHTQSRGWRDIGYNYLVDRFGRIWEGRYGGVTRAVVGAHTLGYNEVLVRACRRSATSTSRRRRPRCSPPTPGCSPGSCRSTTSGRTTPRIYVKNRYLHAINGHRDVGQTACPGRYLYAKIPSIRTAAQRIQNSRAVRGRGADLQADTETHTHGRRPRPDVFRTPDADSAAATRQAAGIAFPRPPTSSAAATPTSRSSVPTVAW